jgi:hypothetical protein
MGWASEVIAEDEMQDAMGFLSEDTFAVWLGWLVPYSDLTDEQKTKYRAYAKILLAEVDGLDERTS